MLAKKGAAPAIAAAILAIIMHFVGVGARALAAGAPPAGLPPTDANEQSPAPADDDAAEHEGVTRPFILPSYEQPAVKMPEVLVLGQRPFREDDLIGDYAQPRWSAARRFAATSIYLLPKGSVQLEFWHDWALDLVGKRDPDFKWQLEVEIGLGHRLQLDNYLATEKIGWNGEMKFSEEKIEMRYAFADWGVLWGNPTLYLEYANRNGNPPTLESKILLGGEMAHRWYWGANIIWERDLSNNPGESEYTLTYAFSYAMIDQVFALGVETKGMVTDFHGRRLKFEEWGAFGGPSLQWRPVPPMHLDFVAFFGPLRMAEDHKTRPTAEPFLIAGWEFR